MLAAGALVASLLAVGTGPAAAVEIEGGDDDPAKASEAPSVSACVGDALGDDGFTDVSMDTVHHDAINCIAYYGVTKGKTADTYAPGDNVSRWQMVQFMERTAKLTGGDADDVLDEFDEDGEGPVTRAEMAVMLTKLVASASSHVVQIDGDDDNSVTYGQNGKRTLTTGRNATLDYFADSRGEAPRRVDNLITAAFELGITKGTGDGSTFSPDDAVTRAQMASFITRALAHTTVRPAGLSGQAVGGDVYVSLRDDNFNPISNEWIDAFSVKTSRADDAFKDDGTCARLAATHPDGASRCKIDKGDNLTQADGDVVFEVGNARTVWAWTGDIGDTFDDDTDRVEIEVTEASATPGRVLISNDLAAGARKARFGSDVTVTIQLQTEDGDDVGPGSKDYQFDVTIRLGTQASDGDDTDMTPDHVADDDLITQDTDTVTVDEDGAATFVLDIDDPRSHRDDDDIRVVHWSVEASDDNPGNLPVGQQLNPLNDDFAPVTTGLVTFDDDGGAVTTVAIIAGTSTLITAYEYADDDGAITHVTLAVLNEYGETQSGTHVKVTAVSTARLTDAATCETDSDYDGITQYTTNRFGIVRVPHEGGEDPGMEKLEATFPGADGGYGNGEDCNVARGLSAPLNIEASDIGDGNTDDDSDEGSASDVADEFSAASQEFLDGFTYDSSGVVSGHAADVGDGSDADDVNAGDPDDEITQDELDALYDTDESGTIDDADDGDYDEGDVSSALVGTFYWHKDDSDAGKASDGARGILSGDVDAGEVVVNLASSPATDPVILFYDSNDRYEVNDDPVGIEEFEDALAVALKWASGADATGINSGTLTWEGYNYRDSDDITVWTAQISAYE